ncbi:hypothetical protein AVEN_199969-1 [Araneus ventricosus]|uniref:Uncharacterized protein n=1 Tax=Araneus ventricosus TaxID=182803 RepID=A0A4Y2BV74_ARAVE|nr:hypothetical protein AVEN_199969-1 [Araneus ventricosus]
MLDQKEQKLRLCSFVSYVWETKGEEEVMQCTKCHTWVQALFAGIVRCFNTKNKKSIFYTNLSSAIRSVPHISEIPVPHPPSSLDDIRNDSEDGDPLPHQDESSSDLSVDEGPQPFSQSELNDLVRDLGLSKYGAVLSMC